MGHRRYDAAMHTGANGAELFFTTRGRGPTVLVPSSIGTEPYERQLPAALDERVRLAFVDLRGAGRSTGAVADLTFDVLADDLEAVRAALGVERVAVLGHSALGALAFEYACRRPASVSHLVLVGASTTGDMAALQAKGGAYFEAHATPERKQRLRENLARLPPGAPPGAAVLAQTPLRFHDFDYDGAKAFEGAIVKPEVLAHLLGKMLPGWEAAAAAPRLRASTLLAHGRHDYVVPWTLWEELAPTLPVATLRLFEKSGHQPFLEEPAAFADAVAAFLSR
jgi:proline iminopeptidase